MGFHYDYNASGAHRWGNCFAYKALSRKAPRKKTSEAMALGTATHFLGEWAMEHGYGLQVDEKLIGACIRFDVHGDAVAIVTGPGAMIGASYSGITWAENPTQTTPEYPRVIKVDESMVKAVAEYMAIVNGIMAKYSHTAKRHVEMSFQLAKDMGGMGDLVIQVPTRLIVLDYKNGFHPVEAIDNEQLAMYGVGALQTFSSGPTKINDVVMGIVQPHTPGPTLKTWTQTTEQMIAWRDRFENARYHCTKVEAEYKAGKSIYQYCNPGKWCKWCEAMTVCPAKRQQTMALAQRSLDDLGPATMPDPASLDDARLLWMAEHGESIIEYIQACKTLMADQAIEQGKQWQGFKLVESVTKRRLTDKDALTEAFKAKGLGQAFEPKLKAMSKLEKIFGKEKMARFIEKPKGSPILVPVTDGRPTHQTTMLAMVPALEKE